MNSSENRPHQEPAEAWLSICDDLLWGFSHALSNRLAAISSITKIIEYSDTGLDPLLSALTNEIATLDRTLSLLRLIPRNPDGVEEPVRLVDLIPELLEVHRLRGEIRDLEVEMRQEGETLPVWAEPARLGHVVLLLLDAASRIALEEGATRVVVTLLGDQDVTVVRIELEGSAEKGPRKLRPLNPAEAMLVGDLLENSGGELFTGEDGSDGAREIELRIPTLPAVRRRESEASTSS